MSIFSIIEVKDLQEISQVQRTIIFKSCPYWGSAFATQEKHSFNLALSDRE
jgi:hypothetical protein